MPDAPHRRRSATDPAAPSLLARARAYVTQRVDPLTSLFLVVPLFVVYQLGVLLQMQCDANGCAWRRNGVDFITGNIMAATGGSRLAYALATLAVGLALAGGALWARRRARLHPRLFVPVLLESALYASLVGPLVGLVRGSLGLGALEGRTWLDDVVASFGAGLHEELIFRAGLFAGGFFLLQKLRVARLPAALAAALGSSLVFSFVHHLGPLGEPFTAGAFVFRTLAGLLFALIYRVRGFAIAAWTHALYDVWVFTLARVH